MTFWKYMFDSEYQQRADIEALKQRSRRQAEMSRRRRRRKSDKINELSEQVEELEDEIGELQLLNRALFAVLRESDSWNEERFCKILHDLDMEDGELDGR